LTRFAHQLNASLRIYQGGIARLRERWAERWPVPEKNQ
jgi:hypothetical protein